MSIIPKKEADIHNINKRYNERGVEYTLKVKEASQTLYAKFMDAYFHFYENQSEVMPRINAVEGKALKSIISYLQNICGDDLEALGTCGRQCSVTGTNSKHFTPSKWNSNRLIQT